MTDNSKIEINPSVLQNRSQTYQSLTDVNGADVFTDDYEEKVKEVPYVFYYPSIPSQYVFLGSDGNELS